MENMIKPALLVLVPILNVVGQWMKGQTLGTGAAQKAKVESNLIPVILICTAVLVSTIYGFIVSSYQGWRMILDAVVMTGLLQGALVAFVSMGVYDTLRKKER
ncbi:phage holin family protein [uncultured Sphaerochaeta sp.]|uniref:phage holin family protein n=1 Tax=uncultured Sphaerochaeta sp. TaxID=886478 RepID=UPI002A0A3196|nr:hypothetical protein [uncultured Sphaerochaeta sp.]